MDGTEDYRIPTECWRKKNTTKKERGKSKKKVERLRAKGRWMNVELSERDKDTRTSKKQRKKEGKEGKESKNPDTIGSMRGRGVRQRKFRSTWGERMQKKEK
jgi:hypothetical protein